MYQQSQKNLLNCPHNIVNFGPLTAEIGWWVCGTTDNFNVFRVLASLLYGCNSTQVNQTLYMFGHLLGWYTIYTFFGDSCSLTELCQIKIQFVPKSCVLLYKQCYCMVLEQCASAKFCCVVQGMELQKFLSLSFSTEGAIYILTAAITLGIGPHSSSLMASFSVVQ